MEVIINHITGIADAIIAMHMSRRQWDPAMGENIKALCKIVNNEDGMFRGELDPGVPENALEEYNGYLDKVLKWGVKHVTFLKFIDLSISVSGLHRAGQDDWDAHAYRFHNRIVRMSTRDNDLRDNTGDVPVSNW